MAFKLALSPAFWAKVEGDLQSEDGGKRLPFAVEMKFKRLTTIELQALLDKMQAEGLKDEYFIHQVVQDWRGVVDDQNEPLEFSRDGLQWFIDNALGPAIIVAFHANAPKAKAKN